MHMVMLVGVSLGFVLSALTFDSFHANKTAAAGVNTAQKELSRVGRIQNPQNIQDIQNIQNTQ